MASEAPSGVRRWNVPVLIIGALLAIAAFVASFTIANRPGPAGPATGSAPVLVAARDIDARSTLAAADVVVTRYAAADVPPGALTTPQAAVGMVVQASLKKNQPLLSNLLAKTADAGSPPAGASQPAFLPLDKGTVATTIPTAELSGVAGYIRAGDYIEVVAIVQPKGAASSNVRTIYTGLHVIRVGLAGQPSGAGASASSLTLAVTQCQAEYLDWFVANAALKYTLLSSQDYQSAAQAPADTGCPAAGSKSVTDADVRARWPGLAG